TLALPRELAPARQPHEQIGALQSAGAVDRHLLREIAMLREPGELDRAPQRELATAPACGAAPQRVVEPRSLGGELAQLAAELARALRARSLELLRLQSVAIERLAQRGHGVV